MATDTLPSPRNESDRGILGILARILTLRDPARLCVEGFVAFCVSEVFVRAAFWWFQRMAPVDGGWSLMHTVLEATGNVLNYGAWVLLAVGSLRLAAREFARRG